jgi:hypothetical protein
MEVPAIAAIATESRLLRERLGNASLDDVDQDLMFPVCGSAEPYYSPDRRAIVHPIQTLQCPQQAANFAFPYGHTVWTLPMSEKGDL